MPHLHGDEIRGDEIRVISALSLGIVLSPRNAIA